MSSLIEWVDWSRTTIKKLGILSNLIIPQIKSSFDFLLTFEVSLMNFNISDYSSDFFYLLIMFNMTQK